MTIVKFSAKVSEYQDNRQNYYVSLEGSDLDAFCKKFIADSEDDYTKGQIFGHDWRFEAIMGECVCGKSVEIEEWEDAQGCLQHCAICQECYAKWQTEQAAEKAKPVADLVNCFSYGN